MLMTGASGEVGDVVGVAEAAGDVGVVAGGSIAHAAANQAEMIAVIKSASGFKMCSFATYQRFLAWLG